jgi:threonine/homoserine/homoserine lactone efflux protein
MTPLAAIAAFAAAAGLITIAPGLDTTLILRTAAVEGQGRASRTAIGICSGLFVWAVAVALGIGAILALSHLAYRCLELGGAAYLVWLGIGMLRHPRAALVMVAAKRRPGSPLVRGLLSNLLNPKIAVFYVTFLPQFVPHGVRPAPFLLLLAAIHIVETALWFGALILATAPLGRFLQRPRVVRALDRICGTVLLGFGLRLALPGR